MKFTSIILPVIIASFIAIFLLVYTWQRRSMRGARPLLPLLLGVVIWLVGSTIEGLYFDYNSRLFWSNVQYIGIVIVPTAWLAFSLYFTDRASALNSRSLVLLSIMPLVTLVLVWTSPWQHFFRISLALNTAEAYPYWEWVPGPGFWLHTIYSYLLLICGVIILGQAYRQSARLHRRQIGIMLLGATAPWLANIFFVVFRVSTIDFTPIAFLITGAAVAWGIFKVGLVEITPIIRKRVIDEMQEGMLVLDEQNRVLEANPAVLRMMGVQDDVLGKPIAELMARWPELLVQFQDEAYAQAEISLPIPGQETRYFQISLSPLHNRKGQQTGQLIMAHEITQQKQTEISLTQAKEAAEAANRAKSTFLATMSHELRTPLAAIIGYSELIQEKSELWGYEKIIPHLGQIGTAAHNLNALIGNILDLSRIEAERMDLVSNPFCVTDLINDVVANIQPQIDKNGNQLTLTLANDLGIMHTDQTKVRQILLNLLGNATKFTHNGTISLTAVREEVSDTIRFSVKDNGEGIPVNLQTKIFQPFIQADSSFTRVHGGSGLGLAISSRFCQMLGGSIEVESKLGEGTNFVVVLPAQLPARPPTQKTAVLQSEQS